MLADKSTEGLLTEAERAEYAGYVGANKFIALLQRLARQQPWDEHFEWLGIRIHGRTAIGRTTVRVLDLNSDDQLALRSV